MVTDPERGVTDPERGEGSPSRPLWTWVTEHPVAALTLLGFLVYASLRLSSGIFYARLGVTPEETGWGYGPVLARSTYYLVIIAVIYLVGSVLGAALIGLFTLRSEVRKARKTPESEVARSGYLAHSRKAMKRSGVGLQSIAMYLMTFVLLSAPLRAWREARDALAGEPTGGGGYIRSLGTGWPWKAEAAEVRWIDISATGGLPPPADCLLYLGESGGVLVFLDPEDDTVMRVAAGSVVVVTRGPLVNVEVIPPCD